MSRIIDVNRNAPVVPQQPRSARYTHNWTSYSRMSVIYEFINELATNFPNLVTVSSIGKSYEGRDMPLVKISTGGSGKNAIVIDGGNNHPTTQVTAALLRIWSFQFVRYSRS